MKISFKNLNDLYWTIFNKLGKLAGYIFVLCGIYGLIVQIISIFDPELMNYFTKIGSYEDMPSEFKYILIPVYIIIITLGWLLLKVKPYYPKKSLE